MCRHFERRCTRDSCGQAHNVCRARGHGKQRTRQASLPSPSPTLRSDSPRDFDREWEAMSRFVGKPFEGLLFEASAGTRETTERRQTDIDIALRNVSDRTIFVKKWKGEGDYEFRVRDPAGHPVPLTEKGKNFFQGGWLLESRLFPARETWPVSGWTFCSPCKPPASTRFSPACPSSATSRGIDGRVNQAPDRTEASPRIHVRKRPSNHCGGRAVGGHLRDRAVRVVGPGHDGPIHRYAQQPARRRRAAGGS